MAAGSFTIDITTAIRKRARPKREQGPVIRSNGQNRAEEHADDLVDLLGP